MSKMFVHYNGTVESFKGLTNLSDYNNKIVFIKGGNDGDGAAIYTHGEFYGDVKEALAALQTKVNGLTYFNAIKVGDVTANATTTARTIEFNAADPSTVSVDVDNRGINIGITDAFKKSVSDNTAAISGEITRATGVEGKLREDLGNAGDSANADGSAFARIAKIVEDINAMTGGNGSISDQINAAIQLLDVEESGEDYVKSIKQVDGKIVATVGTFNFDEKGTAESKANAAESAAKSYADEKAGAAEAAAKSYADGLKSAIDAAYAAADEAVLSSAQSYATNLVMDGDKARFDAAGAAAQALEDAKGYANGLAGNYDAVGSAATAEQNAKNYADGLNQAMDGRVADLEAINHEELAAAASAAAVATILDGAPEAFNTLKEVADWIGNNDHASDVASLVTDVANLKAIDHEAYIAADSALETTLKGYVDGKVDGKFDTVGSAEAAKNEAIADAAGKYQVKGDYESAGAAAAALTQANSYTDAEIAKVVKTHGDDKKALEEAIAGETSRAEGAYAVKGTETVASNAASRAEEAYTLAGQKATAAEAKAQAVSAIGEIAEVSKTKESTYVSVTVSTEAGSVKAVNVDDSKVKTYVEGVEASVKQYADALFAWEEL